MKLTREQKDKLWGEDSPYSQVNLIIQDRILDDEISRTFVEVEADINPLTFEMVKENREEFKDNIMVQQLLDSADYRGQNFGYVVSAFRKEYLSAKEMKEAKKVLEYTRETVLVMHRYVMRVLKNLEGL